METPSQHLPINSVTPASLKDLQELLKEMYDKATPCLPSGLGSRVEWGPPVNSSPIRVSMKDFSNIIDYPKDDLTITVEAGLPFNDLQAFLEKQNQWISIDWPWGTEESSELSNAGSIGGLIARGLSGSLRQKYLGVRDQIVGIEVVRSDGIAARAGGRVVKNVAGYDLMRLLCGSWGSLAFIKEITLRTQPIKPARAKILMSGHVETLEKIRFNLLGSVSDPEYCDWVQDSEGWQIEAGFASISNLAINAQLNSLKNLANSYKIKHEKKDWDKPLLDQINQSHSLKKTNWLTRIVLPPSKIHTLLLSEEFQSLEHWKWRIGAGTGIGDGWQICTGEVEMAKHEKVELLRKKILSLNGQLNIFKQPINNNGKQLFHWLNAESSSLIKVIKEQFDPKMQLSPGRIPGIAN